MPLFLVALLFLTAHQAQAVELSGRYTNLLFQHKDSRNQYVTSDLNRLRLTVDGGEHAWQWRLSYDHELLYGGAVRDPAFAQLRQRPDPTWLDLNANIVHSASIDWRHNLYRGWIQYKAEAWDVVLGRQRIAWGSGRIWNPTDRFNPVQPTALEPDQKLGVDAAYMTHSYSDFGSIQLVAAPPQSNRALNRKWALRWQDTIEQTDMALWLGEVGEERVLAVDVTGNVADAAARLEWQQSWGGKQGGFGQLVVGIDGTLTGQLFTEGLYVAVEYFYNGLAGLHAKQLIQSDILQSNSRQLLGMLMAYDLTPLWRTELVWLLDLEKPSMFIAPSLRWSVSDNMDATIFSQLPTGSAGSEFSGLNELFAVKLEYYF
ncbi:MAG: hypothetical protein COB41_01975 [Proteobacteria bacterium]|nr:MAG: hypothetical protein COB41_01975 [Pseudomonadota bacterium]